MTNTTVTYWEVDGTSLQTYAMNISTLGGSRSGLPAFRGEDSPMAYRRGAEWRPKVTDSRVVSLAMWIRATDTAGALTGIGIPAQMHENLRALQRLLWKDGGGQVNLTKKWLHTDGSTVKSATAKAQLSGTLEPTMSGPGKMAVVADMFLADPFFYGDEVVQSVPYQITPWTVFTAEGDAVTNKVKLEFLGPLVNPTLTLSDPDPDIFTTVGSSIAGADMVTLDCDYYTAIRDSDSANLIGTVTHSGARQWMVVRPGTNTMLLTGSSGSGSCNVRYQPAFW